MLIIARMNMGRLTESRGDIGYADFGGEADLITHVAVFVTSCPTGYLQSPATRETAKMDFIPQEVRDFIVPVVEGERWAHSTFRAPESLRHLLYEYEWSLPTSSDRSGTTYLSRHL
jgi:hypothetical protein